jgi:hypothetical protein
MFFGTSILGLGLGILLEKVAEFLLISIGVALLIIAIFLIRIEYNKF